MTGIVEREAELSALQDVARGLDAGTGAVAVVEGPAGIGKTALLQAAVAAARDADAEVALARCTPLEADFAFGVVRQLFEGRVRERGADVLTGAAALSAPLFGVRPGDDEPVPAVDPAFAPVHGLYWLTVALQDERPLVLAVDDVQWCDQASARFFAYLGARAAELRVALVLALRRAPGTAPPAPIEQLAALPDATVLRPAALTEAGTRAVLDAALGRPAGDELVRDSHAATGGNPFLIRSLATTLADGGDETAAGLVPDTVARAVVLRLRPLPADALALARAVAALGPDCTVSQAARVAGLPHEDALAHADALTGAEVLAPDRPLRFVHPLVGAAVDGETPAGERARLHAAAARVLDADGAPVGRIGAQLLGAEPAGDDWAAQMLDAAAREALDAGAPDVAATLWERALAEGAPGSDRARLLLELGRAGTRAHRPDAVDHLRAALDLMGDDHPLRVATARELGRALVHGGRATEAAEVLDAVLAARGEDRLDADESGALVELECELLTAAQMDLTTMALVPARLERLRARSQVGDAASRLLLAHLAYLAAISGERVEVVREMALRALGDGALLRERGPEAPELSLAANALSLAEAYDECMAAYDAVVEEARRRGSAIAFINALCWRSQVHYRQGDMQRAETDAATSIDVAGEQGWGLGLPAVAAFLADAQLQRGAVDEAEATLARTGLGDEIPDSTMFIPLLDTRASVRWARHDLEGALADLRETGRRLELWLCSNPSVVPWRSRAARVLAALGRADEARELAAQEVELARRTGAPRATGMALAGAAAAEEGERAVALLEEATELLETADAPFWHAEALCDLGAALRRARRPADAREPLRRALDIAHRCGGARLAERAREELVAAGGRPRRDTITGRDALTASERRVAALAAEGLGNREIAQALFLTVKTVEVHLTRTYRKLGIRSRAELAGALDGAGSEVGAPG